MVKKDTNNYKAPSKLMSNDQDIHVIKPSLERQLVYPRFPNYDFLQIEEVNQVLHNFTRKGFNSVSCIYTSKIASFIPSVYKDGKFIHEFHKLRYNFVLVSLDIKNGEKYWTFEVRNRLWNGDWYIQTENGKQYTKRYTSSSPNPSGNILKLQGNLENFRICFPLSNADVPRLIKTTGYSLIGNFELKQQFDETKTEDYILIDKGTKKRVIGATLKFVPVTEHYQEIIQGDTSEHLQPNTAKEKGNGVYTITYSKTKTVGDYYGWLFVYVGDVKVCDHSVTVHKIQNYTPKVTPVKTVDPTRTVDVNGKTFTMYKGEIKTFKAKIKATNKYGHVDTSKSAKSFVVNIYHTYNEAYTNPLSNSVKYKEKTEVISAKTNDKGEFTFEINSRGNYVDKSTIVFNLPKTTNYPAYTSGKYTLKHEWFVAKDWDSIQSECKRENGADAIVLSTKTYHRTRENQTIEINRTGCNKQYILGKKGKGWATLENSFFTNCFRIEPKTSDINELVLMGIRITDTNCAIYQKTNTALTVRSCLFEYNKNKKTGNQGSVVYQASKTACYTDIQYSYFQNNYANCVLGRYNVNLEHNLFKITHVRFTTQPEPFVLEQYSGKGILKNNQFYINTSLYWDKKGKAKVRIYNKNRSYAKISVWVGKTANVNGKTRHQLKSNLSFNFFDPPYNNRGYIFSAYWYPYDIRAFIVASAKTSRINRATGHAVYGTDWAWRDGYYLVREKWKNYNTYNPFITIKNGKQIEDKRIIVPSDGGVI